MNNSIELVYANKENQDKGWVLSPSYLRGIQERLAHDLTLEDIESVVLVANGQAHLQMK